MSTLRRRPWKVRWFSPQWNETRGASYAIRDKAIARGQAEYDEGCFDVRVWQNDEFGYVVPATTESSTSHTRGNDDR